MTIKLINQVYMRNGFDLTLLISLKIIFCYFAFLFFTNSLGLSLFKYPDMDAYKDCIGDGAIMVNVLYSQFLCTIGLNYEEALSSFALIFLASLINLLSICCFYFLFKNFLNRKGQIFFITLLAFHPYLAIYFPRFYTDLFGSLGILLICYYSIKNIKINYFFLISTFVLINFRAALMTPLFLFIGYNFIVDYKKNKRFDALMIVSMIFIGINFLLYKTFTDTFLTVTNFYSQKIYNIIFLLGFREGAANEGFGIFFNGSMLGYIQLTISLFLLAMHSLGLFSVIQFIFRKKLYGIMATLAVVIVPLLTISHLRYLLPIIPLILFGVSWYFFKKESNNASY